MSFNKITIIGNLGRDPELRYTPQGDAVCDFSVAVNDRRRDKSGEFQDNTTWFKVTLWRKQAENASKFLSKGRQVYVEGRLQVEEWTDRDGKVRYSLVIQGSELQFLGEKGGESTSNPQTASDNNFDDNTNDFKRVENTSAPADDDIPF
ncbi:MAG: single-stranded DNA-binding protein [Acidobacteriota bacterium]|nr:single-stranded DNA-binding protein [Acidobacteriota bacterium]